jgi:hypothetical protein
MRLDALLPRPARSRNRACVQPPDAPLVLLPSGPGSPLDRSLIRQDRPDHVPGRRDAHGLIAGHLSGRDIALSDLTFNLPLDWDTVKLGLWHRRVSDTHR